MNTRRKKANHERVKQRAVACSPQKKFQSKISLCKVDDKMNVTVELRKTPHRCHANCAFATQEKTANLVVPVHKTRACTWLLARSCFLVMPKLVLPSGTVCKVAVLLLAFSARPLEGRENVNMKQEHVTTRETSSSSCPVVGSSCLNANSEAATNRGGSKCWWWPGIGHQERGTPTGEPMVCFHWERQRSAIPRPPTSNVLQETKDEKSVHQISTHVQIR
jgi:hypothetical protein